MRATSALRQLQTQGKLHSASQRFFPWGQKASRFTLGTLCSWTQRKPLTRAAPRLPNMPTAVSTRWFRASGRSSKASASSSNATATSSIHIRKKPRSKHIRDDWKLGRQRPRHQRASQVSPSRTIPTLRKRSTLGSSNVKSSKRQRQERLLRLRTRRTSRWGNRTNRRAGNTSDLHIIFANTSGWPLKAREFFTAQRPNYDVRAPATTHKKEIDRAELLTHMWTLNMNATAVPVRKHKKKPKQARTVVPRLRLLKGDIRRR